MAWYDEAVFYHIYPLGLAGAPKRNDYSAPVHRLNALLPWVDHIKRLGFTALYIGPLFQSVGHGYETTDYRTLDSRLGTNDDLVAFVHACHDAGIKVVQVMEGDPVAYPVRKDADTDTLIAAIDEILEQARQDGTLAGISLKYFGLDLTQPD